MALKATEALEGPQVCTGTVKKVVAPKFIVPRGKSEEEGFNICEFEFTDIHGPIRDVIGSRSLTVGLACDALNHQTKLGILARDLLNWDGESELDESKFIGAEMQFLVECDETPDGVFWNINRNSLGPIGHLDDLKK